MISPPSRMTAAILSFNVRDKLRGLLDSIHRFLPGCPIRVWDNGSTDGSTEMIHADYPETRVHRSPNNLYFARGCNELIARCTTPYALLMNADIRLSDASPAQIIDYLNSHPAVIAASPAVRDGGRLRHLSSDVITPARCITRDSFWGAAARHGKRYRAAMGTDIDPHTVFDAAKITNCCCLIRREAFLALGGFSLRQVLYWTEEDFAIRMQHCGLRQSVFGISTVEHDHGSSTRKLPLGLVRAIFVHDRIAYMRAWYGMCYSLLVETALLRPRIWKSCLDYYWYITYKADIDRIKQVLTTQSTAGI